MGVEVVRNVFHLNSMCLLKGRDTKFQSRLLFFEAILHLTRRWRKGHTKASKATVLKIFLFFILIWWPILWSSVQKLVGCLMIDVLLCQCTLKQRTWFYSVPENRVFFSFPSHSGLTLVQLAQSDISVVIASSCNQINIIFKRQAVGGQSSDGTGVSLVWLYRIGISKQRELETQFQDASSKLIISLCNSLIFELCRLGHSSTGHSWPQFLCLKHEQKHLGLK